MGGRKGVWEGGDLFYVRPRKTYDMKDDTANVE